LTWKTIADVWLGIRETLATVFGLGEVTDIVGSGLTDVTDTEVLTGNPPRTPLTVRVWTVPTVEETVHEIVPKPLAGAVHPRMLVPLDSQHPAGKYAVRTERPGRVLKVNCVCCASPVWTRLPYASPR